MSTQQLFLHPCWNSLLFVQNIYQLLLNQTFLYFAKLRTFLPKVLQTHPLLIFIDSAYIRHKWWIIACNLNSLIKLIASSVFLMDTKFFICCSFIKGIEYFQAFSSSISIQWKQDMYSPKAKIPSIQHK